MTAGTMTERSTTVPPPRPWHRRAPLAALVVLLAYGVVSFAASPNGYLGTDTGAKVATLEAMVDEGSFRPAIGYWAAEWDPEATYHPLFDTKVTEDGEFVNVTTLPMLIASKPLYKLGGYRLALVLPMLGALAAAFAARDLARQVDPEGEGWWAFWVTALASPLPVYALDLWEHAPGAGLMLWAIAFGCRVLAGARPAGWSLAAGLLFGLSASMRTETFVVAFTAVAALGVALTIRRRLGAAVITGVASVGGFGVVWFLNGLLEDALGGNPRAARVSGRVGSASTDVSSDIGARVREALITSFAVPNLRYPARVVIGVVIVALLLAVPLLLRRRGADDRARTALAGAALVLLVCFLAGGPAFVPGALIAAPVAVAGFWARPRCDTGWYLLAVALCSTVLIWQFQFLGGAAPQWGGRYILVPTTVLVAIGVTRLRSAPSFAAAVGVASMAVAVTLFGAAWLVERSHAAEDVFAQLEQRPEDVIISTNGFFVREAGPAWDDRRYLSIGRGGDLDGAVSVVEAAGFDTFGVLGDAVERIDGARRTGERVIDVFGAAVPYTTFELT